MRPRPSPGHRDAETRGSGDWGRAEGTPALAGDVVSGVGRAKGGFGEPLASALAPVSYFLPLCLAPVGPPCSPPQPIWEAGLTARPPTERPADLSSDALSLLDLWQVPSFLDSLCKRGVAVLTFQDLVETRMRECSQRVCSGALNVLKTVHTYCVLRIGTARDREELCFRPRDARVCPGCRSVWLACGVCGEDGDHGAHARRLRKGKAHTEKEQPLPFKT